MMSAPTGRFSREPRSYWRIIVLAMLVGAAAPEPAQDAPRTVDATEPLRAAQAQAARLAAQRVVAAAKLRETEAATASALARLDALERGRQQTEARLAARSADLSPLLPLIQRLSLFPAETLLAVPAPPAEALRGAIVVKGLTQQIVADAAAVQRDNAQLNNLTQEQQEATRLLAIAQAEQTEQSHALDQQIADAQLVIIGATDATMQAQTNAARAAADRAANAATVHNAIVTLETERQANIMRAEAEAAHAQQRRGRDAAEAKQRALALATPAGPGLPPPHGQLVAPVGGSLVLRFGEPTASGPATGLSFRAPPNARVVSPCGGRAVFAGPFRSFGLLLIVDCGGGYHFVLAGLARLDVQVGRPIEPGEPVGVMPGWDPNSSSDRPALYIELRREGVPVNPSPWLNAG
jgi:septal ring factor EnvC (AmiA/AmiB activator)